MKLLRHLSLFVLSAVLLSAQAASPAPVSAVELAWWTQLQADLQALRAANLEAGIRALPVEATPEKLSAIAARFEAFLDQRDKDPVADLGPEFQQYRERLTELVDLALTPVTGAAKFKSSVIADGMERMAAVMRLNKEVEAVDDYKPRLAVVHDALNARIVAGGGKAAFFFQTLGVGDKPVAPGTRTTAAERDAQFLADSQAIHPALADLVGPHFIEPRKQMGYSGEAVMEELKKTFANFRERMADGSTPELRSILAEQPLTKPDGSLNLPNRLLQLEILRREEPVAYALALQEWQGAFARWTGKVGDAAPLGFCTDVAVAPDGSWFAYASGESEITVRGRDGAFLDVLVTPEALRSLGSVPGRLIVFTARGIYTAEMAGGNAGSLTFQAERKGVFVQGRLAGARDANRVIYGLGVMPAVANEGSDTTFSVESASSRISAVAASPDGRHLAYGYGGDNLTGLAKPRYDFDVLTIEPGPINVAEGTKIGVKSFYAPLRAACTAIAFSADGKLAAAAWFGRYGGMTTLHRIDAEKDERVSFTFDGQPYQWIGLIDGGNPRVVAGTRTGIVRVWSVAAPHTLLHRFEVPVGSAGVGYALLGEEIVTIPLGAAGAHRWKADGTPAGAHDAPAATVDATALAERLQAERAAQAAIRGPLLAMIEKKDDAERLKQIAELRGPLAAQLDASGQRPTVDYWFATIRYSEINELIKAKRDLEGFELGIKEINAGLLDENLLEITVEAGKYALAAPGASAQLVPRVLALAERAASLHPSNVRIQTEYIHVRIAAAGAAGRFDEAVKLVDELDLVEPSEAPHHSYRLYWLVTAYRATDRAGNKRAAMQYLRQALNYERERDRQLNYVQNIFAIACNLPDWPAALEAANITLNLDPNKKNDETFMYWARQAYQKVNGNK